jgi:uncharacterized membrane protein
VIEMIENSESVVTQDERTMATLAHALQVVGWWIAPLIIFLIHRKSRFVSFHALQALLLQIVYMVLMGACAVLWFVVIFSTVLHSSAEKSAPPAAIFIVFPIIWLGFMSMWIFVLVLAVVYAIKAGRGEWANYPILGKIARNLLKLDEPVSSVMDSTGTSRTSL